jgi:hypothetical protein
VAERQERRDLRGGNEHHPRSIGHDGRAPYRVEDVMVRRGDDCHRLLAAKGDEFLGRRSTVGEERVTVEIGADPSAHGASVSGKS